MERVSDDELLRMLREVEDAESVEPEEPTLYPSESVQGDPCPACGEPAEHLAECHVCGADGCLPPDLWSPGQADACLTLCVRCARTIHLGCSTEDAAGNPRCPSCSF